MREGERDHAGRPAIKLIPVGTPPPPDTIVLAVPLGYNVIVSREAAEDPTIVHLVVDPSQTVILYGHEPMPMRPQD